MQLSHVMTADDQASVTHVSLYGRKYSIYSGTRWCSGVDELWKIIAVNSTKVKVSIYYNTTTKCNS